MLLESHITIAEDNGNDPAEVAIGERLFLETRSPSLFQHANGMPMPDSSRVTRR